MRKILLATTALVGLSVAGVAQAAATSPLTVNLGGDVDFVAGAYSSSNKGLPGAGASTNRAFESIYDLNFSIAGKANNGVEYGGVVGLSNDASIENNFDASSSPYLSTGYIWMSGAFGKVQLGQSHGATDLEVGAPVAGEGQVTGRFANFLNFNTFATNLITGVDGEDHSTNITYFTPKVGNENNKVQLGVSYIPQFYDYGNVNGTQTGQIAYQSGSTTAFNKLSPYQDVVKAALAYEGNIAPVAIKVSGNVINGNASSSSPTAWTAYAPSTSYQDFTAYGLGAQAAAEGFTLGGAYNNQGSYDTVAGQNKNQESISAGLKYDFSKASVGVSYLGAQGYANQLATTVTPGAIVNSDFIKDYTSYGAGGSYTWAPGLTSNLDGVYFDQKSDTPVENKGYVLLVSQKLAF